MCVTTTPRHPLTRPQLTEMEIFIGQNEERTFSPRSTDVDFFLKKHLLICVSCPMIEFDLS